MSTLPAVSTPPPPDTEIVVRRHWNGTDGATYRLADVQGFHWSQISGGVGAVSPRPMVHAYVQCDRELEGWLAHSGEHGPCPHRIKVCIVAKDNDRKVMAWIKHQADEQTETDRARYADRAGR